MLTNEKTVWQNKTWKIVSWIPMRRQHDVPEREHFAIINKNSGLSDFPVKYDDGRIAYDHPHIIPQYVQKMYAAIRRHRG